MGFDHILSAPLFAPGALGDVFLTGDHDRAHPALDAALDADRLVQEFAQACAGSGLRLLVHVVLGRVAQDAALVRAQPQWFASTAKNGSAVDPRAALRQPAAAYGRFDESGIADELADWWTERLGRLVRAGAAGFCCAEPHLLPPEAWRRIIGGIARRSPDARFLAWTPGLNWADIAALRGVGFAGAFSSTPWWDGRAYWFVEEHELLRGIGAVIGSPEAPFAPRLAARIPEGADVTTGYRHMLRRAVATGDGILVPMGYEIAAGEPMDARQDSLADLFASSDAIDLSEEVRQANALADDVAALGVSGEMRRLTAQAEPVTVLLRSDSSDVRQSATAVVAMLNADLARGRPPSLLLDPLPPAAGADLIADEVIDSDGAANAALKPGEVRLVRARRSKAVRQPRPETEPKKLLAAPRIVIDNIFPCVDEGKFPAKRAIGENIRIEADVFADGHEALAVDLLWRSADQKNWSRAPMALLNNDRWHGRISPDRIGRYEFTVEAWVDRYGTLCRDIAAKRSAGADIGVEIAEAAELLKRAKQRIRCSTGKVIASALSWLDDQSADASADLLLTPDLREVMRDADEREFRSSRKPPLPLEIERPQALFAAWYELFPRSASPVPGRHGTFADVAARLPALKDMGFDVLYLPPIHPIGLTNRKGKNNALRAAPDDVGSPYAIGGKEGGHDAVHPALGTIADFRRLRDAARRHGMELALDFAIQCSPDHPWLKQHPEWFKWRPDGSVRYAENPPKKYEDIVNVDFYAEDAVPGLWVALRDVLLHWIDEGVRIFRVDNPHTKPLPFWEWVIADLRSQFPDVIFLSEAFTRPKMMYRLAKAGFTQSYTYFTWRNSKQELTDYFTELTTTEVREFFRPHLFVNTPDINPYFLQTSGRPGFLIRAALAATLSGLWGMYSGFELCEAAPLPGREEYADSEKYQIRVRDYAAPGNIVAEISRLNRIRKANPALQTHLGLRFFPAYNDQVICYGKPVPAGRDLILVAVSLDPFRVQEATIEVPLWEWNLPDSASVAVTDLMRDTDTVWSGKYQRIRLDPAGLPFAIWRITPSLGG